MTTTQALPKDKHTLDKLIAWGWIDDSGNQIPLFKLSRSNTTYYEQPYKTVQPKDRPAY